MPRRPDPKTLARHIELLLLDVDGVLTDGGLYYFSDDGFAVRFDIRDGLGLARAREDGLLVGLVSGRETPQVRRRARELGINEVHLGIENKAAVLGEMVARRGIALSKVCFVGDDLIDLPAMELVGLPVAVADAAAEVRAAALYVTQHRGGRGAVREIVDLILDARRT
ncbi:MAG: HAD hydrolase family protein [Acidobacteriota bacterium]|nr:MAG: HAD hydrolase family protein [Acidobacteriota bacterium]